MGKHNHREGDAIHEDKQDRLDLTKSESPLHLIDMKRKKLYDWHGAVLARVRALIKQADPEVVEMSPVRSR